MDRVSCRTAEHNTTMEVSESRRNITVFHGHWNIETLDLIAEFSIIDLWDMCRDNLAVMDVGPTSSPGLYRRKKEALAAIVKGMEAN